MLFLCFHLFLCFSQWSGQRHYVFRLSVHPSVVPPSVHMHIHWYLKNCEVVLHQTWYEGISWGDDTFFGFQGHGVLGQRSQIILWKKNWYSILHTMRHELVTLYKVKVWRDKYSLVYVAVKGHEGPYIVKKIVYLCYIIRD